MIISLYHLEFMNFQVISTTKENKPDYLCLGDEVDKMDDSYCYRYAPDYLRPSSYNP